MHQPPLLPRSRGISIPRSPPDSSGRWMLVAPRQCPRPQGRNHHHQHQAAFKGKHQSDQSSRRHEQQQKRGNSKQDPGSRRLLSTQIDAAPGSTSGHPTDPPASPRLAFPEDEGPPGAGPVDKPTVGVGTEGKSVTAVAAKSFVDSMAAEMDESMRILGSLGDPDRAWAEHSEDWQDLSSEH